jgi:hypothetical protein
VEQQKLKEPVFLSSKVTGPAVKTAGAGEAVQFNASMVKDQRSCQRLGCFGRDQM